MSRELLAPKRRPSFGSGDVIASTDSIIRSRGSFRTRAILEYRHWLRSSKGSLIISMDTGLGFRTSLSWMSKHSCRLRADIQAVEGLHKRKHFCFLLAHTSGRSLTPSD